MSKDSLFEFLEYFGIIEESESDKKELKDYLIYFDFSIATKSKFWKKVLLWVKQGRKNNFKHFHNPESIQRFAAEIEEQAKIFS